MKKYFILLITMLLFPTIAFAEVKEIGVADFTLASSNPNVQTKKGITYDSQNNSYLLLDGEYRLTEDIAFDSHKKIRLENGDVTILLNGHVLSSTNELTGTINITNTNLTVKGPGSVNCDSNYDDYSIRMNGNNNITIENAIINGINTDMISTDSISGTANLKNVTLTAISDLQRFNDVIIDDVTLDFSGGGFVIEKSNNAVINNIVANNGTAIFGVGEIDSVIINDADLYGPAGLYMDGPVNNIEINGGNFRGQMYSAMFQITDTSNPNVKLKGGTFSVDDPNTAMGNIVVVVNGEADENILKSILSPGFEFSDEIVVETMQEDGITAYIIKNDVSVVHSDYEVLDGDGQTINLDEDFTLKFEFSTILSEFIESGEIYVDGKLVDTDNYVATEGSTIITFLSDFIKTIGVGEHEVTLMTDYGDVTATYTAIKSGEEQDPKDEEETEIPSEKEEETTPTDGKSSEDRLNPKTGDNIMTYALLTIVSGIGLISIRKCKRN